MNRNTKIILLVGAAMLIFIVLAVVILSRFFRIGNIVTGGG